MLFATSTAIPLLTVQLLLVVMVQVKDSLVLVIQQLVQLLLNRDMLAANAMKGGMAILKPLLAETGAPRVGKMVIGTVKGDIHDIGKNLVNIMLEGAGFHVIDIGVQVPPEKFVEAIDEHKPDIVGMSAFLTTTMPMFKVNINAIEKAGLRDDIIIMVGGAPVTQEYADVSGADGYAADAATAVRRAKELLAVRTGA